MADEMLKLTRVFYNDAEKDVTEFYIFISDIAAVAEHNGGAILLTKNCGTIEVEESAEEVVSQITRGPGDAPWGFARGREDDE